MTAACLRAIEREDQRSIALDIARARRRAATAHLAQNSRGEACDDTASKADGELGRRAEIPSGLLRHVAERELMAELVHGELTNGVRYLSAAGY